MNNPLKKKVKTLLEKTSLSISEAERRAGLKTSAIRNIISGQSKNPSAHTLQKLSQVLDCSIYDLLDETEDQTPPAKKNINANDSSLDISDLNWFRMAVNEILDILISKQLNTNVDTISAISMQIYSYSIDNNLQDIDKKFSRWIVEQRFME